MTQAATNNFNCPVLTTCARQSRAPCSGR
jgi:hypothetical protein